MTAVEDSKREHARPQSVKPGSARPACRAREAGAVLFATVLTCVTLPAHATRATLPYAVHWSDIHFDESAQDWVERHSFDGRYGTIAKARSVARGVARQHYMQQTFPVDLRRDYDDGDGDLACYELFYTGGAEEIRIHDPVVCR